MLIAPQYITWIANNEVAWTLNVAGMGPDPAVGISARPIPQEPMVCPFIFQNRHGLTFFPQYIIMNLGMSTNFGPVDLEHLPFPVHMRVDYIRVYQPSNARNVGCDPKDFPTADYINTYVSCPLELTKRCSYLLGTLRHILIQTLPRGRTTLNNLFPRTLS
jgi:hypothetical protein